MLQNSLHPNLPTLFTFRRCPYAIRARLAIRVSGLVVDEIEVKLSDKPVAMLVMSPKGTVPVLQLTDGTVIDESLDIMRWALNHHDPDGWLAADDKSAAALINMNDTDFKRALDSYKYPDRYPAKSQQHYRDVDAAIFLHTLEARLGEQHYLCGNNITFADAAIFPFVRQFVAVDANWFNISTYAALRRWHDEWLASALFQQVIKNKSRLLADILKQ
jgi:glutathione S-transferase